MLLALHGFTETDEPWRALLRHRGDATVPLLPGHGQVPVPAGADLASVAASVAQRLPAEGTDVVGYSMGGRVALRLALDHPGRVRRLVLVSSGPGFPPGAEREERRRRDAWLAEILEEDGIGPFVAWWESNPALKPVRPFSRADSGRLRAMRLNQDPVGLAACLRRFGPGSMDSLWERLGTLRCPVLLIAGAADTRYVTVMGDMRARLPDARLAVIPDCGHAVHREQPAALTAALDGFLR
jgi:2-succinyl-6-hydroxy-2,4-cyclohexadiene-1-carboxylate synthase